MRVNHWLVVLSLAPLISGTVTETDSFLFETMDSMMDLMMESMMDSMIYSMMDSVMNEFRQIFLPTFDGDFARFLKTVLPPSLMETVHGDLKQWSRTLAGQIYDEDEVGIDTLMRNLYGILAETM